MSRRGTGELVNMRIGWICRWFLRSSWFKSLLLCCAVFYVASYMLSDLPSVPAEVYSPPSRAAIPAVNVNIPKSYSGDPRTITNRGNHSTGPALDWLETAECSYFSDTGQLLETKPGTVKPIRENWNLPFSAAFVLCPLPAAGAAVARVGVSSENGRSSSMSLTLPVQSLKERPTLGNLSVCVKPLHYNFNRAVWMVEFIEMYRLLGADRFIFYNHTVGPEVEKVLRHYTDEHVVEVLPWSLPVTTKKDIRTEGIFASLNDCSLRSVGHFPFTAYVDLDEYLIPRQQSNLLVMLAALGKYDAYVFQNVFFYLYWENDTAVHTALSNPVITGTELFGEKGVAPYLLTQTKTRRLTRPHRHGVRSKYIARPERVIEVGNHIVWEFVDSHKKVMNIHEEVALSHHYRICEFGGFDCLKASNEVDRIAQRHMMPLLTAVSAACRATFPDQPACPPAPPLGSPW